MKKLIIDEKVCLKHKLTLLETLVGLATKNGLSGNDIQNMLDRKILVEGKGTDWYQITQNWAETIDEILCDSGGSTDEDRLKNLAKEIQNIFPSGYNRNELTGAVYYHKSNSGAIKRALKRFITNYDDYSDEEILDATRRYVASFRGNYSRIQMANYFVYKDNRTVGGEVTSSLATFLENKESGEVVEVSTEDWKRYSKN